MLLTTDLELGLNRIKRNDMNTPVSYKLALLLREGKFDNFTCSGYYYLNEGYTNGYKYCYSEVDKQSEALLLAPTIAEVVMWLYDVHGLWVECLYCKNWRKSFRFKIHNVKWTHKIGGRGVYYPVDENMNPNYYDSPTKAYEAAIEYVLETLLNG